ncbi:MAG: SHOCT domain-containing protein [Chloroflexi bacterium]|nr:SHOCT domain-containing protein [Chloroflexota bacterium]
MWGPHEGMGWWMVFGGLWMVAFWGVVVGLVVWAVTRMAGGPTREVGDREMPIDAAKRRLASGEINKEEFEAIRDVLG